MSRATRDHCTADTISWVTACGSPFLREPPLPSSSTFASREEGSTTASGFSAA